MSNRILYDSFDRRFKTPFGCVRENEKCRIGIEYPFSCAVKKILLVIEREDGFSMAVPLHNAESAPDGDYLRAECEFSLYERGLYFYFFRFVTDESTFSLFRQNGHDTNMEDGEKWQLSCIPADFRTPDCFKGRTMYQIFPDRFAKCGDADLGGKLTPFSIHENVDEPPVEGPDADGLWNNDFFGGNFRGIESRLDYLASLGVGMIYLNPIFKAYSNHRYDTADYMKPDEMLGTEEDFSRLCEKAKSLGIKIILDGVFSHVGENSIYFDRYGVFGGGAYSDPDSPYCKWFNFESYPDKYEAWWDVKSLPCVKELEKSFSDFIVNGEGSVISHWMRLGASGFRLDVADELPDEFIAMIRKRIKEIDPDGLLIGEVWEDASNKYSYGKQRRYFSDGELDGVMNYPFRNSIVGFVCGEISPAQFVSEINGIYENYPKDALDCCMTFLSTHDTPRILTVLEDKLGEGAPDRAPDTLLTAYALQFFLPGIPCVYYGDEVGMRGGKDPFNRAFFREDGEYAGKIRTHVSRLSSLRNSTEVLRTGGLDVSSDGDVLTVTRFLGDSKISLVCRDGGFEIV
ncbi:MAG: glycoside hydrolase family 13 protein [Firmicutes bacterium]|nr:glycoside hydrolase family 13 protein [Candidatus Colimorpha enterica]